MLNLAAILARYGFELDIETKLARHQDWRWDVDLLYRDGRFETYRSLQVREAFKLRAPNLLL